MPPVISPESSQVPQVPVTYPAVTKQAAGIVGGTLTNVISTSFSDRIMIAITQAGRLAQWIQVPLDSPIPSLADQYLPSGDDDSSLLPMSHLTPKTLLGGSTSEREIVGQLYATQIASAIATRNPEEKRTILVGFGLSKYEANRDVFYDMIDLILKCL
ncbi:hypothetical protein MMC21_004751 [Puttea exsequens]|nr:hypothetical protein [Puttea exsequens]